MLQLKVKLTHLEGLKENVIVGRLVPAGTGLTKIEWDKQAREQDKARLEDIKKTRARIRSSCARTDLKLSKIPINIDFY